MWKQLTIDDLRTALAEDEIRNLSAYSVDSSISAVLQSQLDCAADSFRAAFRAKGYPIDIRDHYVPSSYTMYILALARYWCWTRFPQSSVVGLDDARKELFKTAQDLLKDPYMSTETPEPEYDSSKQTDPSKANLGSVVLPWLRFNDELYWWHNCLSVI